jgi:hypothetical protein
MYGEVLVRWARFLKVSLSNCGPWSVVKIVCDTPKQKIFLAMILDIGIASGQRVLPFMIVSAYLLKALVGSSVH